MIYIPPSHVNEETFSFLSCVFNKIDRLGLEMIILGDFNIDYFRNSAELEKLKNISYEAGLSQIVRFPTRIASVSTSTGFNISSTLIDHIYVNKSEKY